MFHKHLNVCITACLCAFIMLAYPAVTFANSIDTISPQSPDEPISIGALVFWGVTALIGTATAYRIATSKKAEIDLDVKADKMEMKVKGGFSDAPGLSGSLPAVTLPGAIAGPVSFSASDGLTGSVTMNAMGSGSIFSSGFEPVSFDAFVDTLFVIDPETDRIGDNLQITLNPGNTIASITGPNIPPTFATAQYDMEAALVDLAGNRFPILSEQGKVSGSIANSVSPSPGTRTVLLKKNSFPESIPFSGPLMVDVSLEVAGEAVVTPEPTTFLLMIIGGFWIVSLALARNKRRHSGLCNRPAGSGRFSSTAT